MPTEVDDHLEKTGCESRVLVISGVALWCVCCENALCKVAAGTTLFLAARKSTQAQRPGTELCYWPVGFKVRLKLRLRSPKSGADELVSVHYRPATSRTQKSKK